MGLDTVELVMETEEKFGIDLTDEEVYKVTTVEQFHELVCQKCQTQTQNSCATQKVLSLLKNTIVNDLGFKQEQLTSGTSTEIIFPAKKRRRLWKKVSQKNNLKFPSLRHPKFFESMESTSNLAFWGIIILMLICFVSVLSAPPLIWKVLLSAFVLLFCMVFTLYTLKIYVIEPIIPDTCKTLEDLSKLVVCCNPKRFDHLNREEILLSLILLISDQSGLEVEKIKPETTFKEIFPYDYE